jgi:hypothetical protein
VATSLCRPSATRRRCYRRRREPRRRQGCCLQRRAQETGVARRGARRLVGVGAGSSRVPEATAARPTPRALAANARRGA